MSDVDWTEVADIFCDALEQTADARTDYVGMRCAGRPALCDAVLRLLRAQHAVGASFLAGAPPEARAPEPAIDVPPERVGVYRVAHEIGSGGMGRVYLAERADGEFEHHVAVKLLKRGMDSDAILTRFLRERQILAGLEHPNIARLIDGGIAADGRPYFVMEHVEGLSITRYSDERRLSIDERLLLFDRVCAAVEHAHRNLIVHRDLKPSNIHVTSDGRPKLLDFGIAKVLAPGDTEAQATTLTHAGARWLTPEYAAPEQFGGGPITTSTDVYGLGAVLYELLAGRRPVPYPERPDTAGRESMPPSLAVRAADAAAAESIAAARATDPVRLRRRLAGDLDTIVAMALRAEPERRYASIDALRDDIRRHRERKPVSARPDTAAYRISRFVRRHRVGVAATAAIALLVVVSGVTAGVQAGRIARQAAELELERDRARQQASAAETVANFLVGVFEVADPQRQADAASITARDVLDRGAASIETGLADHPDIRARMMTVIARAYDNLTLSDRAEPLLVRALELQRSMHGEHSDVVVAGLQRLALVQSRRGNQLEAESTLREAIAIQQRIAPDAVTAWELRVDLVGVLHGRGDVDAANETLADARDRFGRLTEDELAGSRNALRRMALLLGYSGDAAETNRVYARLVDLELADAGPRSAAVATTYAGWAEARLMRGDAAAADSLFDLAHAIHHELDSTSVATAQVVLGLAAAAVAGGAVERADSLYGSAAATLSERLGESHRIVAAARMQHAETLMRLDRFGEAVPLFERAIATYRTNESDAAGLLPTAQWRLGVALRNTGRNAEAVSVLREAVERLEANFPPTYILTANARSDFGAALVEAGRAADAEPVLRRAIDVLAERWGEDDPRADEARIQLGLALTALNRFDDARALLERVVSRLEANPTEQVRAQRGREALDALRRAHARSST